MGQLLKELRVGEGDVGRVDLVVQRETGLPRAVIRGMFDHGCVKVDGEPCSDAGLRVEAGAVVALKYDPETRYKEKPKARQSRVFDLIFEDEHLLVVNKAAGFLTVPTEARETNTLVEALRTHVNRGRSGGRPVVVIHRLDRDTSGLLVFGKNERIAAKIESQFEARKPEREYAAIVAGRLADKSGTFRSYLATDKALNQRSTARAEDGKLAITHYEASETFADATLVRVTLETGRRNQIRLHFAEKGHPVLGDQRYEKAAARHALWPHRRLALHAAVLGFAHPVSGEPLTFRAPRPHEFDRFCAEARRV